MIFFNSIQSVLTVLLMIMVGYIMTKKQFIDNNTSTAFSKLVVNIGLPAYMISNLTSTFTKDKLSSLSSGLIIPFVVILVSYGLSIFICKLFKIDKTKRGLFCVLFAFSNTMFIGLPVNQSLFGEVSVPYVLLYYIANTTLFWTIGSYGIIKDSFLKNGTSIEQPHFFSITTLKRIFSPPLWGFIISIILIFLEINLPRFFLDACKYVGNITTPLAMFFTGSVMATISIKNIKLNKSIILVLIGRFLLSPIITLIIAFHSPIDIILMKKVFVIQSALPVQTQATIISKAYDGDYEFAAFMVTISTLISLIFIPIYMSLFAFLWP